MAICPAGHTSSSNDYCDTCGLPIEQGQAPAAAPQPSAPEGAQCPNCHTVNAPDALFCEACGYDFTTGTLPRTAVEPSSVEPSPAELVESPDVEDSQVEPTAPVELAETTAPDEPDEASAPAVEPVETPAAPADPDEALDAPDDTPAPDQPWEAPAAPDPSPGPLPPHAGRLLHPQPTSVDWVAEVWIDPDWYATQGSSDALPSAGLPEVVPLRSASALIGRVSVSRNIHPDIDCDPDTGVSRRHAQISTDGTRWWIEDLESANGTFIGSPAGPLPTDPIGRGRVEFAPDQRIYVGGWTRIVIRAATDDEREAFTV